MSSSRLHVVPLEFADRPTLELRATAEHIHVLPVEPGGSPRIEVDTRRGETPKLVVERVGETVVVKAEQAMAVASWVFGAVPFKRLTLFVPPAVRARVRQDFGTLKVERLAGCDLELSASAGSIALDQVRGRLAVSVDSGTIKGEHVGGTFDIRTSAGSVKLGIDALDAGEHKVRTEMGSVKLYLAPGLSVKFESNTTLGSSRVSYPEVSEPRSTMFLSAELGSIRVKEGDEAFDERHGDWPDWRKLWNDLEEGGKEAARLVDEAGVAVRAFTERSRHRSASVPDEELRKVLELVQDGKVSAADAERLIRAMGR